MFFSCGRWRHAADGLGREEINGVSRGITLRSPIVSLCLAGKTLGAQSLPLQQVRLTEAGSFGWWSSRAT